MNKNTFEKKCNTGDIFDQKKKDFQLDNVIQKSRFLFVCLLGCLFVCFFFPFLMIKWLWSFCFGLWTSNFHIIVLKCNMLTAVASGLQCQTCETDR